MVLIFSKPVGAVCPARRDALTCSEINFISSSSFRTFLNSDWIFLIGFLNLLKLFPILKKQLFPLPVVPFVVPDSLDDGDKGDRLFADPFNIFSFVRVSRNSLCFCNVCNVRETWFFTLSILCGNRRFADFKLAFRFPTSSFSALLLLLSSPFGESNFWISLFNDVFFPRLEEVTFFIVAEKGSAGSEWIGENKLDWIDITGCCCFFLVNNCCSMTKKTTNKKIIREMWMFLIADVPISAQSAFRLKTEEIVVSDSSFRFVLFMQRCLTLIFWEEKQTEKFRFQCFSAEIRIMMKWTIVDVVCGWFGFGERVNDFERFAWRKRFSFLFANH